MDQSTLDEMKQVCHGSLAACAFLCIVIPSLLQPFSSSSRQRYTFLLFLLRCNFHRSLCASIMATLPPGLGVDGRPKAGRESPVGFAGRGRPQYLGHSYTPKLIPTLKQPSLVM